MSDELTQQRKGGGRSEIPEGFGFGDNNSSSSNEQRELVDDMNKEFGANNKDPFNREISWQEPEQENESENTEEPTGEEQTEETTEEESAETTETEDTELEEGAEETASEEESEVEASEQTEEAEEEEPEIFYDATRDFPDMDIDPTTYADRVQLNEGFAAKVRYLSELRDQLSERDAGLGAIQLPELFGNSEEFLNQPADREMFASQEDDKAKKTVAELDKAIKLTKGKIDRIDQQREQQQQQQQVSEEFQSAVTDLVNAIDAFGIDRSEAERMDPREILQKANEEIRSLQGEEGNKIIEDRGLAEYNRYMDELKQHRSAIEQFPDAYEKHKQMENSSKSKNTQTNRMASPEEIEDWFGEFKNDNPDLDMFSAPTYEPEKAFRDYVNSRIQRDGFKINSPRDFITLHKDYKNMLQKQSERYGKSKASTEKATQTKKKAGEQRADTSQKTKPPVHKIKNKENTPDNRVKTEDIDKNFDDLAAEMNNVTS